MGIMLQEYRTPAITTMEKREDEDEKLRGTPQQAGEREHSVIYGEPRVSTVVLPPTSPALRYQGWRVS